MCEKNIGNKFNDSHDNYISNDNFNLGNLCNKLKSVEYSTNIKEYNKYEGNWGCEFSNK